MAHNIIATTELMKNQKQALVMSAERRFDALQTREGRGLFFSIGDDDAFYLTQELSGTDTGWKKHDLAAPLRDLHGGAEVKAVDFKVFQETAGGAVDIALAVSSQGQDHLYMAFDLDNSEGVWSQEIDWQLMAYDDTGRDVPKMQIAKVDLAAAKSQKFVMVDILAEPDGDTDFIFRYYVDPTKKLTGRVWNQHDLGANFDAGTVRSALGRKGGERVDGTYTLGSVHGAEQLIYTPLYNPFNPELPATSTRFDISKGADAIATCAVRGTETGVFIAGPGSLGYMSPDEQEDGDAPVAVLMDPVISDVKTVLAETSSGRTVVWMLTAAGQLLKTSCAQGREGQPGAWMAPIPVITDVQQTTTYLNAGSASATVFAHVGGTSLAQLIEDRETSIWHTRSITLPTTDVENVLESYTYTTQVKLETAEKLPVAGEEIQVTASSPVSVLLNNQFTILSPDNPVTVTSDATASVTIVQQTETMGAVAYRLAAPGQPPIDVNPLARPMLELSKIRDGDGLGKITVADEKGQKSALVPSNVSKQDRDAVANALTEMVKVANTLPQDGSVGQPDHAQPKSLLMGFATDDAQPAAIWGVSFGGDGARFHQGQAALEHFRLQPSQTAPTHAPMAVAAAPAGLGDAIETAAGDALNWLKTAWNTVSEFFVQLAGGAYHFIVRIGKSLIRFVLNSVSAVLSTIEFIFKKIKVFFEKLVQWLGFLFNWDDILDTHVVIKNMLKCFIGHSIQQIPVLKGEIHKVFQGLEEKIDQWAGLEVGGDPLANTSSETPDIGQHSPQANYGLNHYKNGSSSAAVKAGAVETVTNEVMALLKRLEETVLAEAEIIKSAYHTIQTQIVGQLENLSFGEILKRLLAVIADVLLQSIDNLVGTVLDIAEIILQGILDLLDAKLEIPVLSWLYRKITGSDLSVLDLVCLIAAIPATVIVKMTTGTKPFQSDDLGQVLRTAGTWSEMETMIAGARPCHSDLRMTSVYAARPQGNLLISASPGALESGLPQAGAPLPVKMADAGSFRTGFVRVMRILAVWGSIGLMWANIEKRASPRDAFACQVLCFHFFLATLPNYAAGIALSAGSTSQATSFWNGVGSAIYLLTCVQKLVDLKVYNDGPFYRSWEAVSPSIDATLGIAGLAPSIAAPIINPNPVSVCAAIGNVAWNGNRITSPFAGTDLVAFAAKEGLIGTYAVTQLLGALNPVPEATE
ncbi:MAG: hypothetical protein AAGH74_00460 [Pseudomonadota bacterium]